MILNLPSIRWVSLFAGFNGLHEGITAVTGGELVAVSEFEPDTVKGGRTVKATQAPARVLAHRFPGIPNLGDVARVDWAPWVGIVDGLSGGFPCQDVSVAGLGAGLQVGTRSGLWFEFARAIFELRPALVVIENVPGLRSARAGDPTEVEDEEASGLGPDDAGGFPPDDGRDARPVRGGAFSAVLWDLARLGYSAEWVSVRASDVGAPHRRERVFIMAYRDDLERIDR